jgi:hypothetical protein
MFRKAQESCKFLQDLQIDTFGIIEELNVGDLFTAQGKDAGFYHY